MRIGELEEELKVLPFLKDATDDKKVIMQIRGDDGRESGNVCARDLYEMYQRYADRIGYKVELLNSDPSDMGGFNEVTFLVNGDNVWTRLKFEGGVHRVQRVPATE